MEEVKLNMHNFEEEVKKTDKPVLIDFYATWCGPCKMLAPIVSEIAKEGTIKVLKVDVDEESALANAFQVVSIPTLFAIQNGKAVGKLIGYHSKEEILKLFQ